MLNTYNIRTSRRHSVELRLKQRQIGGRLLEGKDVWVSQVISWMWRIVRAIKLWIACQVEGKGILLAQEHGQKRCCHSFIRYLWMIALLLLPCGYCQQDGVVGVQWIDSFKSFRQSLWIFCINTIMIGVKSEQLNHHLIGIKSILLPCCGAFMSIRWWVLDAFYFNFWTSLKHRGILCRF